MEDDSMGIHRQRRHSTELKLLLVQMRQNEEASLNELAPEQGISRNLNRTWVDKLRKGELSEKVDCAEKGREVKVVALEQKIGTLTMEVEVSNKPWQTRSKKDEPPSVVFGHAVFVFLVVLLTSAIPSFLNAGLFTEHFDDSSFASRGWYDTDAASSSISTVEKYSGAGSYECAWAVGGTGCSGGTPKRYLITPSEELYVTYYVKHSANFGGSGSVDHPHIFYFLSDLDGIYDSLAVDYLTTYIEENWGSARTSGVMRISTQDSKNIPHYQTQTPAQQDLVGVTENRDVSGCSGTMSPDSPSSVDCYWAGSTWRNDKRYNSPAVFTSGNKNAWHEVTTHLKMNSISNGIAVADGKAELWLDGVLQYSSAKVVYRTGQHPTMKWNQLILSPYIGAGSPVAQSIWIDELNVSDVPPGASLLYPRSPVIRGVTP
jgi:transposase-like protein